MGLNCSVGIKTGYGLDGPGIESRLGARFSAPVQTGRGAHPASCIMGTGSFLGVKRGQGMTLTPNLLLVPRSRKSGIILLLPLRPYDPYRASVNVEGCTYLYLLTPWCRVLLEKLTGLQLVKKFPALYGTRRFITALTSVRHLSLSWASPIQSIYPHHGTETFLRS